MKYKWDKKYLYTGITTLLVICASIFFYYLLFHGTNLKRGIFDFIAIASPILAGLGLAYLLTPILNFVEQCMLIPLYKKGKANIQDIKTKKRIRLFSILITVLIVFCFAYGFFLLVIPQIIKSIQSIMLQFPLYMDNLSTWSSELLSDNPEIEAFATELLVKYSNELEMWLNQYLLPQINEIIKTLSLSVIGFLKGLWNLLIGFILSIYILSSKETLCGQAKKIAYALMENRTANIFINDVRFTHRTFIGFLGGKIVDSIIIGIICFVVTSMIGTPYAVLVSVIIGVTNVIPFFGPYLGAIPCSILILMVNPLQCLYFVIFIIILQQFDGNILGPKILGEYTGLSSFWVIFAITIFGGLFGIFGMFIGVPTFAVIYAGFKTFFNRKLRHKGLTDATSEYMYLDEIGQEDEFIMHDEFPSKEDKKEKLTFEMDSKEKPNQRVKAASKEMNHETERNENNKKNSNS